MIKVICVKENNYFCRLKIGEIYITYNKNINSSYIWLYKNEDDAIPYSCALCDMIISLEEYRNNKLKLILC